MEQDITYGFVYGIFQGILGDEYGAIKRVKEKCDKLIVGVFSDDMVYRITDKPSEYSYEQRCELLSHFDLVDEIIEITQDIFSFRETVDKIYERVNAYPKVFIVGSEYGKKYLDDKALATELGIELVCIKNNVAMNMNHLMFILDNEYINYDIVLFGTGKYFDAYMEKLGSIYPPIYAIDNDSTKWNTKKNGIIIKAPDSIINNDYKHLLVIVCAKNCDSMVNQLSKYGDVDYRCMTTNNEIAVYDEWRVLLNDERNHIEKSQSVLTGALFEFDRVCKLYNLRYYLNCGNIIGAVRHAGLIPWDDDIDVIMFQQDFDILKSHAKEIWPEGGHYKLVCPGELGNSAFLDFMNRLMCMTEPVESNTFIKVKGKADKFVENKLSLDIYVLNNAPDDEKKHYMNAMILKAIYGLGMGHRAFVDYNTYIKFDKFTQIVVKVTSIVGRMLPLRFIIWLHEKFSRKYDRKATDYVFESNGQGLQRMYKKEWFGNGKKVTVCGREIPIPEMSEEYLEEHGYINIMQYPPANTRKPTHGVKSPDLV